MVEGSKGQTGMDIVARPILCLLMVGMIGVWASDVVGSK